MTSLELFLVSTNEIICHGLLHPQRPLAKEAEAICPLRSSLPQKESGLVWNNPFFSFASKISVIPIKAFHILQLFGETLFTRWDAAWLVNHSVMPVRSSGLNLCSLILLNSQVLSSPERLLLYCFIIANGVSRLKYMISGPKKVIYT